MLNRLNLAQGDQHESAHLDGLSGQHHRELRRGAPRQRRAGYYSPLGVVNGLNGLAGDLSLQAGTNVTLTPGAPGSGQLVIAATGSQGPLGLTGLAGVAGSAGTNGLDGKTVLTGKTGPIGPAGPQSYVLQGGTNSEVVATAGLQFMGVGQFGVSLPLNGTTEATYQYAIPVSGTLSHFEVFMDKPTRNEQPERSQDLSGGFFVVAERSENDTRFKL